MTDRPEIKLSDELTVQIVDPDNVIPVFAEIVTEAREIDGIVCLSFGTMIMDGTNEAGRKVRIVSRLRMTVGRVESLARILANVLAKQPIPKEMIN